eukprot:COSAG06_NODE_22384_length_725_cov_1.063898_1_plen_163_part_10
MAAAFFCPASEAACTIPQGRRISCECSAYQRSFAYLRPIFISMTQRWLSVRRVYTALYIKQDGYVDCDEFLQFLMDRESLRNTQQNSLGGGLMINNGSGAAAGSGMQTVCLRLQRRRSMRSSQQHGPSAPIAGQANAYMAERSLCLDGLGMYATSDRHKGIVL